MSREYYQLLKLCNFDFKTASDIYLAMTDQQRIWLSTMIKQENRDIEARARLDEIQSRVFRRGR